MPGQSALNKTTPRKLVGAAYVGNTGVWQAVPIVHEASQKAIHDAQNPQAVYDAVSNRTYLAFTGERRKFYVSYFDHTTKTSVAPILVTGSSVLSDDDHSTPTIFVDKFGYICIGIGNHDGQFHWAKSANPRDISAWNVRSLTEIPSGTYLMTAYDAASHTIYLSYRSGTGHGGTTAVYPTHEFATLARSTDGGVTFTDLGPSIDTRLADPQSNHDAYVMDTDVDAQGRVHMTWEISAGTGHDGIRRNVHHAYWNPSDGHWHTLGGVDLGVTITDFTSARVATQEWVNSPRILLHTDGTVMISWVGATPSSAQPVVNTTLSVSLAAASTQLGHVAKPTFMNSSSMVVGTGGAQETLWSVSEPSGSSGNYTTIFSTGTLPRNVNAHASGDPVVITPMVVGTFVAHWTGSAWAVVDTGARGNHLYAVPCLRQNSDGTVDLYTTTGGADSRSTIIYALSETIIFAGVGGDLSRYVTSDHGGTWANAGIIVPANGVAGQGISLTSPVLNGNDDLKVVAQPGMVAGPSTWRLPIYGVSDKLTDAKVGAWKQPHGGLLVWTDQQPTITSTVPTANAYQQSFLLPPYVPRKAVSVLLRVLGYGDGTAGEVALAFRQYSSGRGQDVEFNIDRGRTVQWQRGLVEVALAEGMFEYQQTGGLGGIRIIVVGFRYA